MWRAATRTAKWPLIALGVLPKPDKAEDDEEDDAVWDPQESFERLKYRYYCFRQGTANDLQLFLVLFLGIASLLSLAKVILVDRAFPEDAQTLWYDFYEIMVLSFGQEFPENMTEHIEHQAFSLLVAGIGLAAFALVLALVEQYMMELIRENVEKGTNVYEKEHVLILGWCTSQRDLEVVFKSLAQLCLAHANTNGVVVVVMTQRGKQEMEDMGKHLVPMDKRYGTRFVFRQGNPLLPDDLRRTAAAKARNIMIVSDQSRCPEEADAQSLRCAILLSELLDKEKDLEKQKADEKKKAKRWTDVRDQAAQSQANDAQAEPSPPASRPASEDSKAAALSNAAAAVVAGDGAPGTDTLRTAESDIEFTDSQRSVDKGGSDPPRRSRSPGQREPSHLPQPLTALSQQVTAMLSLQSGSGEDDPAFDAPVALPPPTRTPVLIPQRHYTHDINGCVRPFTPPAKLLCVLSDAPPCKEGLGDDPSLSVLPPVHACAHVLSLVAHCAPGITVNKLECAVCQVAARDAASRRSADASKASALLGPSTWVHHVAHEVEAEQQQQQQPELEQLESSSPPASPARRASEHQTADALGPGNPSPAPRLARANSSAQPAAERVRVAACAALQGMENGVTTSGPASQALPTAAASGPSRSERQASPMALAALPGDPGQNHIVVELKTSNARPLLQYSCTSRFQAVSTNSLNARRLAKMLGEPIIANLSQIMLDRKEASCFAVHPVPPHLVGQRFEEVMYWWDHAVILGVYRGGSDRIKLNAHRSYKLEPKDQLIMYRASHLTDAEFTHLPQRKEVLDPGDDALSQHRAAGFVTTSGRDLNTKLARVSQAGGGDMPGGYDVAGGAAMESAMTSMDADAAGSRMLHAPRMPAAANGAPGDWMSHAGQAVSTRGNNNDDSSGGPVSGNIVRLAPGMGSGSAVDPRTRAPGTGVQSAGAGGGLPGLTGADAAQALRTTTPLTARDELNQAQGKEPYARTSGSSSSYEQAVQANAIFMVPLEFLTTGDRQRRVLVCGWGEQSFMRNLLRELDSGGSALKDGSVVVFANTHDRRTTLDQALEAVTLRNIRVEHVKLDPLVYGHLKDRIRIQEFTCAIILCDERWIDPDQDKTNGVDMLRQADMLRLDSMVMMVQLQLRKLLDDFNAPTMNIICQKVATEGQTKFEDRCRMPLGVSVNFTSFAAKVLTQACTHRLFMPTFLALGTGQSSLTVMDSSELVLPEEQLNWWQVARRAQHRGMILVGWYSLPKRTNEPLQVFFNPSPEDREMMRIWNPTSPDKMPLKLLALGKRGEEPEPCASQECEIFEDRQLAVMRDMEHRTAPWLHERKPQQEGAETEEEAGRLVGAGPGLSDLE